MELIFERLKAMEKAVVFLDVLKRNKKAFRFYKNIGFKTYGEFDLAYTDFKEDRRRLIKMIFTI